MTTLNPSDKSASVSLSGGNLILSVTDASSITYGGARGTTSKTTGKPYFEATYTKGSLGSPNGFWFGLAQASADLTGPQLSGDTGYAAEGYLNTSSDALYSPDASDPSSSTSFATGDKLGFAADIGNALAWVRKNGTWLNFGLGTPDPAAGTGGVAISSGVTWYPVGGILASAGTDSLTFNFGGSAFAYTVPTGFSAWDAAATNIPAIMKYLRDQGLA